MNAPLRSLPALALVALLVAMAVRPVTSTIANEAASPASEESIGQQPSVLEEEPTATPVPTEPPLPIETPSPTDTPAPTATPEPTATPTPTATPDPTATATPNQDEGSVTINTDAPPETTLTLTLTAKDAGPEGAQLVDFGHVAPTAQEPTAAGVAVSPIAGGATYFTASAVTVTVTSNGPGWTGSCYASGAGATALDLAWTLHGSGDAPAVFAADASGGQGCIPTASDGTTAMTYTYDYQMIVTWADLPGNYSSTIIYAVSADPSAG